jgi:hypothetical protein
MTTSSAISELLERRSVVAMESTIPPGMTIEQWRRQRSARPPCDHLHESTTRYDHDRKLLTFLLVCAVCHTEKVVETRHYEPSFTPGATVHHLPLRRHKRQLPRAA